MRRVLNKFDQQRKVLQMSAELWNEYVKLENKHPNDEVEFRFHIHAIQNIVAANVIQDQFGKIKVP